MRWISTTIKKKYLDQILFGTKNIERKVANEYWNKRLNKILADFTPSNRGKIKGVGLSLLCGQESYKFKVTHIYKRHLSMGQEIDGVWTKDWWEIHIGDRIE
jgi:hypothetical protein